MQQAAAHSSFIGGSGSDIFVNGKGGRDYEDYTRFDNKYYGNDGNDELWTAGSRETYYGGNGDDLLATVRYTRLDDSVIKGEGGNDLIHAGEISVGLNNVFDGGAGNDSLTSWLAGSELLGGTGNDVLTVVSYNGGNTLTGGQGEDTYVINLLANSSVVSDNGTKGEQDTLAFGFLTHHGIDVSREGDDLVLSGYSDMQVTVDRFFVNGSCRIERLEFKDGVVWTDTDVEKMIQAMAASPEAGASGDAQEAGAGAQELNLLLAAGGAPASV
ncbi:Ca2+-binding RTX toxin-like protein [Paenibacillus mucilaginosus]|uniref:calcium-binding protein n=1 Tax=Paenibacillus mucilaginosus TaxID=61624 RepID=UPI003D1B2E21